MANRATSGGLCLGGDDCNQRFRYEWDEVGRLSVARRWDASSLVSASEEPVGHAAVELRHIYDGSDQRVLKTAIDVADEQSHTVYAFGAVELRRTTFGEQEPSVFDYQRSDETEVGSLFAHGVRLARLHHDEGVPFVGEAATGLHVLLALGDHLGSTSTVLDKATSELVEKGTYQGYGAAESDYRPGRWGAYREDYRFTGKEEDAEVGLTYFGKRFLNPSLGRWISADPLAVHVPGDADINLYAYVHGQLLRATDPTGLCDENGTSGPCGGANNGEGGEGPSAQNEVEASPSYGESESAHSAKDVGVGAAKGAVNTAVTSAVLYGATVLAGPVGAAVAIVNSSKFELSLKNDDERIGAAIGAVALPIAGEAALSRFALGGAMRLRSPAAQTAEHVATSATDPAASVARRNPAEWYIPRDANGKPIPLSQVRVRDVDIPTPFPEAKGPHTVIGARRGEDGQVYRQTAEFSVPTFPKAQGHEVPLGRVDWYHHGSPESHAPVHIHGFTYDSFQRRWVDMGPRGFSY